MRRWLAWNVLFPLHERLKGHPTFRILREMEAAERLSATEVLGEQAVRERGAAVQRAEQIERTAAANRDADRGREGVNHDR